MNPEEGISRKEWSELTTAEKIPLGFYRNKLNLQTVVVISTLFNNIDRLTYIKYRLSGGKKIKIMSKKKFLDKFELVYEQLEFNK